MGSNVGDRHANLAFAVAALREIPAVRVFAVSEAIETEPVGGPLGQGPYLNAAAGLQTTLRPRELLELLLAIERRLGRVRAERWGPRTLDLDLLLYDDRVIDEPGLRVPHPRMHERLFVLRPLAAIAPSARHPVLGTTVREILDNLLNRTPPQAGDSSPRS